MKFLKEQKSSSITIYKYEKNDLILQPTGIIIQLIDKSHSKVRLPALDPIDYFISKSQLAEFKDFIYIPEDQLPEDDGLRKKPKEISKKSISKAS